MSENQPNGPMPPPGLSGEALAEWWRQATVKISWKPKEGLPRQCPHCLALNPCSGNSSCIQCEKILPKSARRINSDQFDSPRRR